LVREYGEFIAADLKENLRVKMKFASKFIFLSAIFANAKRRRIARGARATRYDYAARL
jgi:hypothetical protein